MRSSTRSQIGEAMKIIARIHPKVLAINGGDGTVQAALTEIYNGGHFGDEPPPVAVLPSGKTNLIAFDLGARSDPIETLERLIELARTDLKPHTVARELIALRHGDGQQQPVIGMFLGGAGLADTMLYCRDKIYPLGLPNGFAHVLTAIAFLMKAFLGMKASFLPPDPKPLQVSVHENGGAISGLFSLLAVTTLEKLLITDPFDERRSGSLKLLAHQEHRASSMFGAIFAQLAASSAARMCAASISRKRTKSPSKAKAQHHPRRRDLLRRARRPISSGQPLAFVNLRPAPRQPAVDRRRCRAAPHDSCLQNP